MSPTANSERPIRFAGAARGAKRHICAFFRSPEEEYRVLLPFIKEGIERGEKAFHVVIPSCVRRTRASSGRRASTWAQPKAAGS
jgi:hypothetical protein